MAGIADELRRIPMSPGLGATLARAADYAQAQSHAEVALEHLLLALTEDDDAAQVLSASHVDTALLVVDVSQYLGGLDARTVSDGGRAITLAADLKRILEAAAAAASQGRRREINGAIVLAAIVGDGRSSAAHMLRAQGLTFEEAIKALQQALAATPPPSPAPMPAVPMPAPQSLPVRPETEDIIATARARVQTRAAPGLPPPTVRRDPDLVTPAQLPAAAEPPVLELPAREMKVAPPAAPQLRSEPTFAADMRQDARPAPWPPEVRTNGDAHRLAHDSAARLADDGFERHQPTLAAGHPADDTHPHPDDYSEPAMADAYEVPSDYQPQPTQFQPTPSYTPPPVAALTPTPHRQPPPQPGTRWPAPVAPAWRDQPAAIDQPLAETAVPPPLPHPGAPPPLPAAGADWAGPATAYGAQTYRGPHYGDETYGGQTTPPTTDLPNRHWPNGHWPNGQTLDGDGSGPPADAAGAGGYGAPWPDHDDATGWSDQPVSTGDAQGHVDGPSHPANGWLAPGGAEALVVPDAAAEPARLGASPSSRRRKAPERASAGSMLETIPRRMRVQVASQVDVRLANSEFRALTLALQGDDSHQHPLLVTPAMSVRLLAPDGGFMIQSDTPETQWLENNPGALDLDFAHWCWTVTPLRRGKRQLRLVVSARTISGHGVAGNSALPDQVITVRVAPNYGRALLRLLGWAVVATTGAALALYGPTIANPMIGAVLRLMK